MNSARLLERFLRYVAVNTMADETAGTYPSSPGQLELGQMLAAELSTLGLNDVCHDQHGLVLATLPANVTWPVPVVAWNAHLDTSPETSGTDVRPQIVRPYTGGDIVLPGDRSKVIRVADNPELEQLHGATLITSDGTTLLGADDKAGVAVIMEAVTYLLEHPEIPHGPLRILFTCDEEIGHGVDHVDLQRLGACACYTLDGSGANTIDVETFSADLATVTVRGVNIHPSIAKGRMVNAVRAAALFLNRLPHDRLTPELSEGRQGFLHPYALQGGVAEVTIKILLRDFDTGKLADYARLLQSLARDVEQEIAGVTCHVAVQMQYRNMAEGLQRDPRAVAFAQEAHARLGRRAELTVIRGGTDGSMLTARGLPTPNLACGQHTPHSPLEWACLEEMVSAVEVLVETARVWCQHAETE
ncbi:MAG: peptidase T [Planctomycetaceae bacterium]|nr:peptidase T [Planctomycetaceae bacterium]